MYFILSRHVIRNEWFVVAVEVFSHKEALAILEKEIASDVKAEWDYYIVEYVGGE